MTETQAILELYRQARADNLRASLATVVRVEGSAYRRPGARMLITETGQTSGVLSGGCLEQDVSERAARVMQTGEPVVVKYDTTTSDDIVWGFGLGCSGVVHVLIEPAAGERLDLFMLFLAECSRSQRRGAVATVIHHEGEPEAGLGARALLYPDGAVAGELISPQAFDDLREAAQSGTSTSKRYETETGAVEAFIEVVEPLVPFVVFGAGHDALPLVAFARKLGWHTTVVDTQARAASRARFGAADAVLLCRPEDVSAGVPLTEGTTVVVMTHNYLHDRALLKTLLPGPARYVGCLGPKQRTERLLQELLADGLALTDARLSQLHAPVGLDIGAETPEEVALSIIAEIKAVLARRGGGLLRDRTGSIH